LCIKLVSGQ